jgi:hypothetical protein
MAAFKMKISLAQHCGGVTAGLTAMVAGRARLLQ